MPSADWPDDCHVQWGASGIVLEGEGSRLTAFFEAFPQEGAFIRGEGKTIAEAEADALGQYIRSTACDHLWARAGYLNGGATCRRCGQFRVMMRPVVTLGGWKAPATENDIARFLDGSILITDKATRSGKFIRRSLLRLRAAGYPVPDIPDDLGDVTVGDAGDHPYVRACRDAIFGGFLEGRFPDRMDDDGLEGMLTALAARTIRRLYQEWREEKDG